MSEPIRTGKHKGICKILVEFKVFFLFGWFTCYSVVVVVVFSGKP